MLTGGRCKKPEGITTGSKRRKNKTAVGEGECFGTGFFEADGDRGDPETTPGGKHNAFQDPVGENQSGMRRKQDSQSKKKQGDPYIPVDFRRA